MGARKNQKPQQSKYAVFILTNGRPDRVFTYDTLRRSGYHGPVYLVLDDQDETRAVYEKRFPKQVIVFSKEKAAELFDVGDNQTSHRGVVYARNAIFKIAEDLGFETFIVLDDDYRHFQFRFDSEFNYKPKVIKNLGVILDALVEFFHKSSADSVAIAQGGDFIGGETSSFAKQVKLTRKLMNLFILSTKKPIEFMGRINEDVNVYTNLGARGRLFFTLNQLSLEQMQTQSNPGGLTEIYLDTGTYVKSFYSVIFQPSSVKVAVLRDRDFARIHHRVNWDNTVPKIIPESFRKDGLRNRAKAGSLDA